MYRTQVNKEGSKKDDLPVVAYRSEILAAISESDQTILMGETASGKTTQVPQFIFDHGINRNGQIAITQPRRMAAISLASYVANERQEKLGKTVGYSVRFEEKASIATRIHFMTDGMLLRIAMTDPLFSAFTVIILDEVHERNLNTDLLLGIIKRAQVLRNKANSKLKNDSLKCVIMSATAELELFINFFPSSKKIFVPGRTSQLETYCVKPSADGNEDYFSQMISHILYLHDACDIDNNHILVFLPGQTEIEALVGILTDLKCPTMSIVPLYSSLSHEAQLRGIEPPKAGIRNVVVSTNIAETSLTIPGIRIVLDSGLVNRKIHVKLGFDWLKRCTISQAESYQRAGRAGREHGNGTCYRFYTNTTFSKLERFPEPEIRRSSLTSILLCLLKVGIMSPSKFDWFESPSHEALEHAKGELEHLGAIKNTKEPLQMEPLGYHLAAIPLNPRLARILLLGGGSQILGPIASLLSLLSSESLYTNCKSEAEARRQRFMSLDGDLITYWKIFREFQSTKQKNQFCTTYGFNLRSLQFAIKVKKQLLKIMENTFNMSVSVNEMEEAQVSEWIRNVFHSVYPQNIAHWDGESYRTTTEDDANIKVSIHPTSVLAGMRIKCLHFMELTQLPNDKVYVNYVSLPT